MAASSSSNQQLVEQLDNQSENSSDDEDGFLEDIDANTEEGRRELQDRLSALDIEIEEAMNKLSGESIQVRTQEIHHQLIGNRTSWDDEVLEAGVECELLEYQQHWFHQLKSLKHDRNLTEAHMFKADCSNIIDVRSGDQDDHNAPSDEKDMEDIDVNTEEGQQQLLDRFLELESEIEDAQECLENESMDRVAEEVQDELKKKNEFLTTEELKARVEAEVQEYERRWMDECERLEHERDLMQDRLQDLGIDLKRVYQALEPLTALKATTSVWREAARPNCNLSVQAATAQRNAEAALEKSSPIVCKHGKIIERGASGFLKPLKPPMRMHQGPLDRANGWNVQLEGMYEASTPAELAELMPDNAEAKAVYDLCNNDDAGFKSGSAVDELTPAQTRDMLFCDESQDVAKETRRKQKALKRMADVKRARSRRAKQVISSKRKRESSDADQVLENNAQSGAIGLNEAEHGGNTTITRPTLISTRTRPQDIGNTGNATCPCFENEFNESTKCVQQQERDRQERLSNWEEDRKNANCLEADCNVINPRRPLGEPPVKMSPILAYHLQPHQLGGVRFMWESLVGGSVIDIQNGHLGAGCILAHSMGLGKTLQVITLLHTMLTRFSSKYKAKDSGAMVSLSTALILTPVNTMYNWKKELEFWTEICPGDPIKTFMMEDKHSSVHQRLELLEQWHESGGIMIMGYEKYRILISSENQTGSFAATLQDPGPDVLVCDEGHMIKNNSSSIARTLAGARTLRRVALTGSPLQNSVMEYYCMVDFVRKGFLGEATTFKNRFVVPISKGQHVDSTEEDVKLMKQRVHVLYSRLQGIVERVGVEVLREQLPPKYETVLCIRLSKLQRQLYQHYLDTFKPRLKANPLPSPGAPQTNGGGLFNTHSQLLKVWNHPDLLRYENGILTDKQANKAKAEAYSVSSPLDISSETVLAHGAFNSLGNPLATNNNLGVPAQAASSSRGATNISSNTLQQSASGMNLDQEKQDSGRRRHLCGINEAMEVETAQNVVWYEQAGVPKWWTDGSHQGLLQRSGKLDVALTILQHAETLSEKTLIFSQSLDTITLLEMVLGMMKWTRNEKYFRMDGNTPGEERQNMVEKFNSCTKDSPLLMIISTRAGSLGLNLVGASRVILVDTLWNPTYELQAVFRAYRYGQNRPVHVYRLLSAGTMEEKMYWQQITKQGLAARIVDEHQVPRTVPAAQPGDMYTLEPDDFWETQKDTHAQPYVRALTDDPDFNKQRDPVLTNLALEHPQWITRCFEHQSHLQNILEERLSPEEQEQAWQGYMDDLNTQDLESDTPKTPKGGGKARISSGADTCGQTNADPRQAASWKNISSAVNLPAHDDNAVSTKHANNQMNELQEEAAQGFRVLCCVKGEGEVRNTYEDDGKLVYVVGFYGTQEEEHISDHELIARGMKLVHR